MKKKQEQILLEKTYLRKFKTLFRNKEVLLSFSINYFNFVMNNKIEPKFEEILEKNLINNICVPNYYPVDNTIKTKILKQVKKDKKEDIPKEVMNDINEDLENIFTLFKDGSLKQIIDLIKNKQLNEQEKEFLYYYFIIQFIFISISTHKTMIKNLNERNFSNNDTDKFFIKKIENIIKNNQEKEEKININEYIKIFYDFIMSNRHYKLISMEEEKIINLYFHRVIFENVKNNIKNNEIDYKKINENFQNIKTEIF